MNDEGAQASGEQVGQVRYRLAAMNVLAVRPVDAQSPINDQPIEVEQMTAGIIAVLHGTRVFLCRHERRSLREKLVKLPQVVEADLRARQFVESPHGVGVAAQVTQGTVGEAASRERAELFFNLLQRSAHMRLLQLQADGKDRRKPSDRARQVYVLGQRLSPMPFEIDQQIILAGPQR